MAGRFEEAILLYRRALDLEPGSPRARYNLSLALLDTGESKKAFSLLEELANEYPDRAMVRRALAVARDVAGEKKHPIEPGLPPDGLSLQDLPYSRQEKTGILYPLREQ